MEIRAPTHALSVPEVLVRMIVPLLVLVIVKIVRHTDLHVGGVRTDAERVQSIDHVIFLAAAVRGLVMIIPVITNAGTEIS